MSQATRLIDYAKDLQLFHSPDGQLYASVPVGSHREEIWPLRSAIFRQWLTKRMYDREDAVPKLNAVEEALNLLAAKAQFDGPEQAVSLRVAEHNGALYLDLCNESRQAVLITPEGWKVVRKPRARFRRTDTMRPLPGPLPGKQSARKRLEELRRFINVATEDDWVLVVTWLLAAFRPTGPYPLLVLHGEQGTAKSTTTRFLRALIDPNVAPLRSEPKDVRDLMIAADNSWVLAFDNLSYISPRLSDALCRLSTGGGFGTRQLYTDGEEKTFNAQRPVILNGIEESETRSDLLDRVLILHLPQIDERKRQPEAELQSAFEDARPRILGTVLDVLCEALRLLPKVNLERHPRMADFTRFGVAVERGLGWKSGTFLKAYEANRETADEIALDSTPVAAALRGLLQPHQGVVWTDDGESKIVETVGKWHGTAADLLRALNEKAEENAHRMMLWPKSPRSLRNALERLKPHLRRRDRIEITFGREGRDKEHRRFITIVSEGKGTAPTTSSPGTEGTMGTVSSGDSPNNARDGARGRHRSRSRSR